MKTMNLPRPLRRFLRKDDGVSVIEYALLVGIVAGAMGAIIVTFGGNISTAVGNIGGQLATTTITAPGNQNPAPPSP